VLTSYHVLAACEAPDVERRREFAGHETLFDTSKARDLLDWEPAHSVQDLDWGGRLRHGINRVADRPPAAGTEPVPPQ